VGLLSDVSSWQSVKGSDYERALASGESGVIVKLSQGERRSKKGMLHVAKALAAGLPVGAYHFADPLKYGLRKFRPIQQADAFCDAVEASGLLNHPWPLDEDEVPRLWLDMEWKSFGKTAEGKARGRRFRRQFKPSQVMEWTRLFIGRVQARLGVTCGIYTGRSYVKYRYRYNEELRVYPLWLAAYVSVGDDRQGVPSAELWPEPIELEDGSPWVVTLWQFTGRGSTRWYRLGVGKIDRDMTLCEVVEGWRLAA
jgi:GH25 family lysozyme M1 (1,4-beta-N-acetylmuramidase)